MPSIQQQIAANQARIAAGGVSGNQAVNSTPEQNLVQPAPTPPVGLPTGVGLPQRGIWPANLVLASDRDNSNTAFRGAGARSSTFPFPGTAPQITKTTVKTTTTSTGTNISLQTNGIVNSDQAVLNLIQGSGVTLAADASGGVTITSLATTDGLTHGTLPWETDPSSFLMAEDFCSVALATITTNPLGPYGTYGWFIQSATPALVIGNEGVGALNNSVGGSVAWENDGTQGQAATLAQCFGTRAGTAQTNWPIANPLLENPGWKATFIWKLDASANSTNSAFSAAKKAFYIGFSSPGIGVTANNTTNAPTLGARPNVFIGVRYDTSTGTGFNSVSVTAVGTSSGGNAVYTVSTQSNYAVGAAVGQKFTIAGMTAPNNNGTFTCVSSTTTALILNNPGATTASAQSGTATCTNSSLADTGYVFEAVGTQTYASSQPRRNVQGQTSATGISVVAGVWHRLDITCTVAGTVVLSMDGGAATATFVIPQITCTGLGFGGGLNTVIAGQTAFVTFNSQGGNQGTIAAFQTNTQCVPFSGGSKITVAGYTGGNSVLNGTWTLGSIIGTAGNQFSFNFTGAGAATAATPTAASVAGYPSLLPFVAFGNDDQASPSANVCRVFVDFIGLAVNVGLGAGGTATPSKARYF